MTSAEVLTRDSWFRFDTFYTRHDNGSVSVVMDDLYAGQRQTAVFQPDPQDDHRDNPAIRAYKWARERARAIRTAELALDV